MKETDPHNLWNQSGGPKYPHEKVIQFCFRAFPAEQRESIHALDLGCGGGIHTAFLAREGFCVTAVDPSSAGVENTRDRLARESLSANVEIMGLEDLDFPPATFDLVICSHVLQCVSYETAQEGISRLLPSLKTGARGFFQFTSSEDTLHKASSLNLRGYSENEVRRLFDQRFEGCHFDRSITTYQGGSIIQNEWIVTFSGLFKRIAEASGHPLSFH